MPLLTDDEFVEVQTTLNGLEGVSLYNSADNFVSDQRKRFVEYGQDMRVSPKQWKWLRDLYEEKVGPLTRKDRVARPVSEREADRPDIDDDIPF